MSREVVAHLLNGDAESPYLTRSELEPYYPELITSLIEEGPTSEVSEFVYYQLLEPILDELTGDTI